MADVGDELLLPYHGGGDWSEGSPDGGPDHVVNARASSGRPTIIALFEGLDAVLYRLHWLGEDEPEPVVLAGDGAEVAKGLAVHGPGLVDGVAGRPQRRLVSERLAGEPDAAPAVDDLDTVVGGRVGRRLSLRRELGHPVKGGLETGVQPAHRARRRRSPEANAANPNTTTTVAMVTAVILTWTRSSRRGEIALPLSWRALTWSQAVSDTADGLDVLGPEGDVQLASEPSHVDLDDVGGAPVIDAPGL